MENILRQEPLSSASPSAFCCLPQRGSKPARATHVRFPCSPLSKALQSSHLLSPFIVDLRFIIVRFRCHQVCVGLPSSAHKFCLSPDRLGHLIVLGHLLFFNLRLAPAHPCQKSLVQGNNSLRTDRSGNCFQGQMSNGGFRLMGCTLRATGCCCTGVKPQQPCWMGWSHICPAVVVHFPLSCKMNPLTLPRAKCRADPGSSAQFISRENPKKNI